MEPVKHWDLKSAIAQLESCDFSCDGGGLKMNDAFVWLKGLSQKGPNFVPGQGVWFEVEADAASKGITYVLKSQGAEMSEIVERLRDHENDGVTGSDRFHLRNDAADEIDRPKARVDALQRHVATLVDAVGYAMLNLSGSGMSDEVDYLDNILTLPITVAKAHDAMVRNQAIDECANACREISETEWEYCRLDHNEIPWSLSCAHKLEKLKGTK